MKGDFIFAIFAFSILFSLIGTPSPISNTPLAVIGNVSPGSAAANADLKRGDQIVQIDDLRISFFSDLQQIVRANPNNQLSFRIIRDNLEIVKVISPDQRKITNTENQAETIGFLGISADPGELEYERQPVYMAVWLGIERTYVLTTRILSFISEFV